MTHPQASELLTLAEVIQARAIEYASASLRDPQWDKEERERLWTADSAFRVAASLRALATGDQP